MAKIQTKVITVTFSKIVRDTDSSDLALNKDILATLEEVAQEMCGTDIVVEAEVINE
jgi:hypothetical protein